MKISLWKISPGSNRWLIPWTLSRKSVSKIAQTHMQKSYQYVRICIHVNLFSLFLDIMSYLIMVTSVEEESSFPLPTQNPVQGSFGGDHMLWSLWGRGRTPTGISRGCRMAFAIPSSRLLFTGTTSEMGGPTDWADIRTTDSLPTGVCISSPGWVKSQDRRQQNTSWLLHLRLITNTYVLLQPGNEFTLVNYHVTWKLRYLQLPSFCVSIPQIRFVRLCQHSFIHPSIYSTTICWAPARQ